MTGCVASTRRCSGYIDAHNIAGAVTLVMRNGRLAHFEAHGLADVESNKKMTKDALFRIWSMSKPVTGVAILMLMEEGKVRLNDPVSRYIPEFNGMKVAVLAEGSVIAGPQDKVDFTTVEAKREITIQDLLTHVSGLGSGRASGSEIRKVTDMKRIRKDPGRCYSSVGKNAARFSTRLTIHL